DGGKEINSKFEARNPKGSPVPDASDSCLPFGFRASNFEFGPTAWVVSVNTVRPNVRAMAGYTPGELLNDPDIVKLNTNENPYPPSPRVFEAVRAALTGDKFRKYPPPLGDAFRKAAGRVLGVDPDCILIGNGSDDVLTILTRTF